MRIGRTDVKGMSSKYKLIQKTHPGQKLMRAREEPSY